MQWPDIISVSWLEFSSLIHFLYQTARGTLLDLWSALDDVIEESLQTGDVKQVTSFQN